MHVRPGAQSEGAANCEFTRSDQRPGEERMRPPICATLLLISSAEPTRSALVPAPAPRNCGHRRRASPPSMVAVPPRRIAVVGAGIGGLALARALGELDTGVQEVVIFDRRAELKPGIGGGIQINGGAAVLARLGLGEQMRCSALPVRRILSRKTGGFELLDIDVASLVSAEPSLVAADGTPQAFSIMRDALQRLLVNALPSGTSLQLGRRLESLTEDASGVELTFEDGATERFDLVVGADGLSSRVRQHVQESHAEGGRASVAPPCVARPRYLMGDCSLWAPGSRLGGFSVIIVPPRRRPWRFTSMSLFSSRRSVHRPRAPFAGHTAASACSLASCLAAARALRVPRYLQVPSRKSELPCTHSHAHLAGRAGRVPSMVWRGRVRAHGLVRHRRGRQRHLRYVGRRLRRFGRRRRWIQRAA